MLACTILIPEKDGVYLEEAACGQIFDRAWHVKLVVTASRSHSGICILPYIEYMFNGMCLPSAIKDQPDRIAYYVSCLMD